ncbi:MAG: FAD-dependent oxidoreductase [Gammaproteobacteria bacterium]|nr:FAD-dependent oxidoreductase [Gammaproteobacteria bacterium]
MMKQAEVDIAIVGGGVAGLWLLNRLKQLGYSVILLECHALGSGQTSKAQGIIHGGTKYALHGSLTDAALAISEMPAIWKKCLAGEGSIDLTSVPVTSTHQYLFSPNKFTGKLAGFFASFALQGKVVSLDKKDFPDVFKDPKFKGLVYALDEIAIDVNALVKELAHKYQECIFKIEPLNEDDLYLNDAGGLEKLHVRDSLGNAIEIHAEKYIFTAGIGNEIVEMKLKNKALKTQRRPLHMVVMKTDYDYPVFAHCLGLAATPRMTITTHKAHDGKTIWYLGGQIAEEGVNRDAKAQAESARKECEDLFPWLNFSTADFASFIVDRAEALQENGKRPDTAMFHEIQNVITAWPTKLALAPKLAEDICENLEKQNTRKSVGDISVLKNSPHPDVAKPIWDELL